MKFINIFINEIKIPLAAKSSIKDIIMKFFHTQSEFIVSVNAKIIQNSEYNSFLLKENDKLQVIAYSEHIYQPHKRTIFKQDNGEKQQ